MSEERKESLDNTQQNDINEMLGDNLSISSYVDEQLSKAREAQDTSKTDADSGKSDESVDGDVSGKKSPEESKTDANSGKSDDGENKDTVTITAEQYQKALGDRPLEQVVKAYDEMSQWNKNLKEKAQAIPFLKGLSPEREQLLIAKLKPFIDNYEAVPDTPDDLLESMMEKIDIPESIDVEMEDEDGLDINVKVPRDHYLPVVKDALSKAITNALPELAMLRGKQGESSKRLEELEQTNEALLRQNGELVLSGFFSRNSQYQIETQNGETPVSALFRVVESGETHPQYNQANSLMMRFEAAGDLAVKKQCTIDTAWETLYGKDDRAQSRKREAQEQVLENQSKSRQEQPGKSPEADPLEKQKKLLPKSYTDYVEEVFK